MEEPKVRVESSLSVPLANRLKECMKIFGIKSTNKLVQQVLEVGLNAIENAESVNTPEKVKELMKQREEGLIVDYIAKLDRDAFNVLFSIVVNEGKSRGMTK